MEKTIEAIPTIYRGVQLRSRMEAQCCLLFDRIGWEWQYEPYSFQLPSGTQYRPDFWIPKQGLLVECRGYHTEKGDQQIAEFAKEISLGKVDLPDGLYIARYLAIITGERAFLVDYGSPGIFSARLAQCFGCGEWFFEDREHLYCWHCGHSQSYELWSQEGIVIVGCLPVSKWEVPVAATSTVSTPR